MKHEHTYKYLDRIDSPKDLRAMDRRAMPRLAEEIREFLIDKVGEHGGHLASNLGVVELSIALHRVFHSPHDRIIFDVGHQSYTHKILTGRREDFDRLRTPAGLSGFTSRSESAHDPFGAGHSSTALSAAIGFAEADRIAGRKRYTVAVIGDGAFTGGMVHEALNNCSHDLRLIVILNENEMSISKNIGAFARYMAKIRSSGAYTKTKQKTVSTIKRLPLIGDACFEAVKNVKKTFKNLLYASNYFEELGLFYLGPADGNDYFAVERLLRIAKQKGECSVIHLRTCKGKGYAPAERLPQKYHSVYPVCDYTPHFSQVFGEELVRMAHTDKSVVAITAAMTEGTGLSCFRSMYPERFFDVGIAESHATTFAAGLAAGGVKPFFAVYSTFLQRAYDNILHDAALQRLPIKLCIDRASLSSSDGPTHHGIFDVAFLSGIPELSIYAPATFESMRYVMHEMAQSDHPTAMRYPNATEDRAIKEAFYDGRSSRDLSLVRSNFSKRSKVRVAFVGYGRIMGEALRAEALLRSQKISAGCILLEKLKPYEECAARIEALLGDEIEAVVFVEEGIYDGGASMILTDRMKDFLEKGNVRTAINAIYDHFVRTEQVSDLLADCSLRGEDLAASALSLLEKKDQ